MVNVRKDGSMKKFIPPKADPPNKILVKPGSIIVADNA
jgi:hypothetical protein